MRRRHRFEQIVGKRSIRHTHCVGFLDETGERHDRNLIVFPESPKLGYQIKAVEIRQQEILQDQVGAFFDHHRDSRFAVGRFHDSVTVGFKRYPDDFRASTMIAMYEMSKGRAEEAVRVFSRLLEVDPNSADAYNMIGYHYGYRGDYEKAIENLRKYQFMSPDQANPHDSIGEIQAYSGHYDEAIVNLNHALKIDRPMLSRLAEQALARRPASA